MPSSASSFSSSLSEQKQPPEYSVRKGVLRNFTKFEGKHLCQSLFFNKVSGLRSATLLKKKLWHRCFPVNFANSEWSLFAFKLNCNVFCKRFLLEVTLLRQSFNKFVLVTLSRLIYEPIFFKINFDNFRNGVYHKRDSLNFI